RPVTSERRRARMCRIACERLRVEAAMSVAAPLYPYGGMLTGPLTGLLATACRERRTHRLRSREVDDETVSVKLHHLAYQIGADVIAAGPARFLALREIDDHPDRKAAIMRARQVLTQRRDNLGFRLRCGNPGLVTQNSSGGVAKMRRQAVEHHGAVLGHGGQAAQPAVRFGAEPAESIDQGKIHHFFRLLRPDGHKHAPAYSP